MEVQDFPKGTETIRISGTLDAAALYIAKEFGVTASEAVKVATLLWLEQECELAEATKIPKLNVGLKSLAEFGDENTKARGMVANSRVFINLEKAKVEAFRALPIEVVEGLPCRDDVPTMAVKALLHTVCIVASNTTLVKEGLACVCMRAWHHVKGREHILFPISAVMPGKEDSRDGTSCLTCELTQDDGRQHIGNAGWECPCHTGENYCTLTLGQAKNMLDVLVQQGVLEFVGDANYAFL